MDTTLQALLDEARAELPRAVELRRRLHQHPELGLLLPRTKSAVLEDLAELDLPLRESRSTSGWVATVQGARPGPSIVLRADMDALPMPEDTDLPYASREPNRMHACGHDAHTAMLAGAARLLHRRRASFAGRVELFFQPGEEGWFGALRMLEEGLLDDLSGPTAAFALHIDPRLEVGVVTGKPGPVLAAADFFRVELRGRGGHASMPHDANDPIPAACELVGALQAFTTRRFDVFDPVVISVTRLEAGTTNNVIPERATLVGTIRSVSEAARARAREGLERLAAGIAAAHGLEATVELDAGYPVTSNDPAFTAFARSVVERLAGPGGYLEMDAPVMGAEDFSYLLQRFPGAMLRIGVRPPGEGPPAPCHSNRMLLDERGMALGIALHAAIALEYLRGAFTSS